MQIDSENQASSSYNIASLEDASPKDHSRILKQQAFIHLVNQKIDKAILYYRESIKKDPDDTFAYERLGRCYLRLKKYQQAMKLFIKATELNKRNKMAWHGIGQVHFDQKRYLLAIQAFDCALSVDPEHEYSLYMTALSYRQLNFFENALKFIDRAIQLYPDDKEDKFEKWQIYIRWQKYDQALKYLDSLQQEDLAFNLVGLKGKTYFFKKEYQQAIQHFEATLQYAPRDLLTLLCLGKSYMEIHLYNQSNNYFKRIIQVDQGYERTLVYMAENCQKLRIYQQAASYYLRALKYDPNNHQLIVSAAIGLMNNQAMDEAFKLIQMTIKMKPDYYGAYACQGIYYKKKELFQRAIESNKKAIQLNPYDYYLYLTIGRCYNELKNTDLAIQWFQKSLNILKTSEAYLLLGYSYFRMAKMNMAILAFNQALNLQINAQDISKVIEMMKYINLFKIEEKHTKKVKVNNLFETSKSLDDQKMPWQNRPRQQDHINEIKDNFAYQLQSKSQINNNIKVIKKYHEHLDKISNHILKKTSNPFVIFIIQAERTNKLNNKYFNQIIQYELFQDHQIDVGIIEHFERKLLMNHEVEIIILMAFINKAKIKDNGKDYRKYFYMLIHFPKKYQQAKKIENPELMFKAFVECYEKCLHIFEQKVRENIFLLIFWHFLKFDEKCASLTYKFAAGKMKNVFMNDRLNQFIITHHLSKIKMIHWLIEDFLIENKEVIRAIDFPTIKLAYQDGKHDISELAKSKKIQFFRQACSQGKENSSKFIKGIQTRVKALINVSVKTKKVQKVDEKLFAFLIKSFKLQPQIKECGNYVEVIKEIEAAEQKLKAQIVNRLKEYAKQSHYKIDVLLSFIEERVFSYFQQTFIFNEFAKFVLNQIGFLLKQFFPEKAQNLSQSLFDLLQGHSWSLFKEQINKLYAEDEQMTIFSQNSEADVHLIKEITAKDTQKEYMYQENTNELQVVFKKTQKSLINHRLAMQPESEMSLYLQQSYTQSRPSSNIDSSLLQQLKKNSKYLGLLTFTKNAFSLPFPNNKEYIKPFRSLLLNGYYNMLSYISQERHPYIADHAILHSLSVRKGSQIHEFTYTVAEGEWQFSDSHPENKHKSEVEILSSMGPKIVYCWLLSAAKMLHKFQEIGLYQADFRIRNTVKFGQVFRAIDFDYAFQIQPGESEGQKAAYKSTREIIKYWLDSAYDRGEHFFEDPPKESTQSQDGQIIIKYLFKDADEQQIRMLQGIKKRLTNPQQRLTLASKIDDCLEVFKEHSKKSHFQQFKYIFCQITNKEKEICFGGQIGKQLLQSFTEFQFHRDYLRFTKDIYAIFAQSSENNCKEVEQTQKIGVQLTLLSSSQFNEFNCLSFSAIRSLAWKQLRSLVLFLGREKPKSLITYLPSIKEQTISNQVSTSVSAVNDFHIITWPNQVTQKGRKNLYLWIISLARAIMEVEGHGIYCAKIELGDVVRWGEIYKFKANAYSYAVCQRKAETKTIIRQLILIYERQEQSRHTMQDSIVSLFPSISGEDMRLYLSIIEDSFFQTDNKVEAFSKLLQKRFPFYHLQQFKTLCETMLTVAAQRRVVQSEQLQALRKKIHSLRGEKGTYLKLIRDAEHIQKEYCNLNDAL